MSDAVVELRDVFRVHRTGQGDAAALQGAELDLRRGEVLCLLGPSGAGKSTLLRVVAGIETPSAGTVRVLGTDIGRQPERARARFRHRYLGLLAQSSEGSLSSTLTVAQAVALPLALRGLARGDRGRRAAELLEAVALTRRGHAQLTELSGGERQRVALAGAIAHRPALLLADEPTGELDQKSAAMIRQLITGLARASGMTVLIASHDPAMASTADRSVTIAGGRIAEERRGEHTMLVVNRGGWLRLPHAPGQRSELPRRARGRLAGGDFVIEPTAEDPIRDVFLGERAAPPNGVPGGAWRPAQVEVRALQHGYGHGSQRRVVLHGMSHRFARQRLTVVVGSSGSGKSTLLRLIAGLDLPDAGEVLIDTQPLTGRDREQLAALRRERIGYMPQEPTTVDFLSAGDNVVLGLELRGVSPSPAAQAANTLLAAVGMADRVNQRVHRLSAGEVQRVALARAMATAQGLLILDEPTSRLDENSADLVASLITQAARGGQTVICATHDPRLTEQADERLDLPMHEALAQTIS